MDEILNSLVHDTNQEILNLVSIFTMGCTGSKSGINNDENRPEEGHIMISYNHTHKKLILKIKDVLKENGFPVWIDADNMDVSLNDSMAEAVEMSHIVLVCMSKKYMASQDCKMEAEYAKKNKKMIIPLKLERDFDPKGWLGAITAGKKYFDFTGKVPFKKQMKELIKELNKHYVTQETQPESTEAEMSEDEDFDEEAYYNEYIAYTDNEDNNDDENGQLEEVEKTSVENDDNVDDDGNKEVEQTSVENVEDDGNN